MNRPVNCLFLGLFLFVVWLSSVFGSDTTTDPKGSTFTRSSAAQHTIQKTGHPTGMAAGDTAVSWDNSWSYSTIGLDYDSDLQLYWYAHESQSSTHHPCIYLTDSSGTVYTSFALSETNSGWPWQLDNRTGIDLMPNGNLLLPDYNGDLSYADDNIVEITPDGIIVNAWEMDDEVGSNDCANGYSIHSIIDIAAISCTDDTIHAYATAAYDSNMVYEIKLARTGTLWTPNSWVMVGIDSTETLGLEGSQMRDVLGIDIMGDKVVLSSWHTTQVAFFDLDMTFIDTVYANHDSSGGYNSGVCFVDDTNPLLMTVTDFNSDYSGIPETGFEFNTPPTVSDIADTSAYVNIAIGPIDFTIDDDNTEPANLTVTATSDNQALIPDANLSLGGSGHDRTLTVTPAADQSGTAKITVTVTDERDLTATDQFDVTIIPVGSLLHVDSDTGVDDPGRDGSSGEPFATLSYAVGRATANDSIDITGTITADGVAGDGIVIDKHLVLRGQGADETVIQGHATDAASADRRCLTLAPGVSVFLKNLTLRHGNADGGGAIKHSGDALTLNSCVLTDNLSTGSPDDPHGGAILSTGSLRLVKCTVSNNSSDQYGGGIYAAADLTLERSTLSGNTAVRGGAVYCRPENQNNPLKMTNSTVSGNTATTDGGAVYLDSGRYPFTITLTNVTVADNSGGSGGASGLYASAVNLMDLDLVNCLLDNSTLPNYAQSGSGSFTLSRSYTLCSDASMDVTGMGNQNTVDPLLQPLADNGGDTKTHALAANSPAVDAGTAKGVPNIDQRGMVRPLGLGYDIGAVERVPQTFFVNATLGVDAALRDGSVLEPWATISYALGRDEVGEGDILNLTGSFVADGVSGDGIVIDKSLTLTGQVGLPAAVAAHSTSAALADRRCFTIASGKTVSLMNMQITNGNAGSNYGGGIYNEGYLNLTNCTVHNNEATRGGGIYSTHQLQLSQTTLHHNRSVEHGGGIFVYLSDPTSGGGGMSALPVQNLSLLNCTLSGNIAGLGVGFGGGVYLHAESVNAPTRMAADLVNVTLANNSCTDIGAGMFLEAESADVDSAVIRLRLKNSILSSASGSETHLATNGSKTAVQVERSHTLVRDVSLSATGDGNLNNIDPLLDPLNHNGGDTPTHALQSTSPAKNAGTTDAIWHTVDQRGQPHVGAPDMGSYEAQGQGVKLALSLWLDGPYDADGDSMTTRLHQQSLIPQTSPYEEDPVTLGQLPDVNLVDWILVQLLSADGTQVMASQSAFLTRDGSAASTSGADTLVFDGITNASFIIQVQHRNHLQVRSSVAVPLSSGDAVTYDFTTQFSAAGTNPLKELESDVWGLPAGDATSDGELTSRDYVIWYNQYQQGISGYRSGDFQLNGTLDSVDYDLWEVNTRTGYGTE